MSGRYKFKDYKGCPGVSVLQAIFDLTGTMCNLLCLGSVIYSVKNCNIWIIFLCIAITIGYLIAYIDLGVKLENWGREKEAKKQKEREKIRRTAAREELVLLAKQEKKEEIWSTVGVILAALTVPVIFGCIFILILMYVP